MGNPVPEFLFRFYTLLMPLLNQFNFSSLPKFVLHHNIPPIMGGPGVYAIFSIQNGKMYVGESANVLGRLSWHWRSLNSQTHDCLLRRLRQGYNRIGSLLETSSLVSSVEQPQNKSS